MMKVGIVAGEASGDQLGASLIKALKKNYPNIEFEGIAGPQMMAQGAKSLFPMEVLSVRGYWEVIRSLKQLLAIRKKLIAHFISNPPDLFIGIDAPDFNLGLEESLRKKGIKTVQMVAPTVWAWREGRLPLIRRAVDRLLTIFPFEKPYFDQFGIPVTYIGHPLINQIPYPVDHFGARKQLGLTQQDRVVALLPGSRASEIDYHGELFVSVAEKLSKSHPQIIFLVPLINSKLKERFQQLTSTVMANLDIRLIEGNAHLTLAAADLALVASGTATLEAALFDCPQVVTYKLSAFTAWMVRRKKKKGFVALPNLILNKPVIDEWLQETATIDNLALSLEKLLIPEFRQAMLESYQSMRIQLAMDTEHAMIEGIEQVLNQHGA